METHPVGDGLSCSERRGHLKDVVPDAGMVVPINFGALVPPLSRAADDYAVHVGEDVVGAIQEHCVLDPGRAHAPHLAPHRHYVVIRHQLPGPQPYNT